jgi:hypothetical protein
MFESIYRWLASADTVQSTDLIFVLAGLQSRKSYGLELFRRGLAHQVLLSTGRFEVRRFVTLELPQRIDLLEIVKEIPPPQRHFFVSFTDRQFQIQRMSVGPLGTLREIDALRQWLRQRPEISSLLIVSSETHLRRLRICCEALLPRTIRAVFAGVQNEDSRLNGGNWWRNKGTRKMVLIELLKIVCYSLVLPIYKMAARRPGLEPPVIHETIP